MEFLTQEFLINVVLGQVNGASMLYLAANNEAVDTGLYSVLWHPGGTGVVYPSSAINLNITSTSDLDVDTTGTGARKIFISGLDSNYEIISETISMNGIAGVNTSKQYLRLLQMRVIEAGSTENNVGSIAALNGANPICYMDANDNRSSGAVYTVPKNHIFLVKGYGASVGGGKEVHIHVEIKEPGHYYEMRDHMTLLNTGLYKELGFCGYIKEKSDLRAMAKTILAGPVDVSGALYGVLLDTSKYRGLTID